MNSQKINQYTLPDQMPRQGGKFTRWFGRLGLRVFGGWQVTGDFPDVSKAVVPVGPHTSNWDFFIGLFAKFALGLRVSFLGKHSIFVFPIKRLLENWGGIPVRRDSAHGVVGQMVEEFERREQLILVLSPEGTRSKVKEWKKGFLHIALGADVPVVPIALDFSTRTIQICEPVKVTEDIDASLAQVKQRIAHAKGKFPELA